MPLVQVTQEDIQSGLLANCRQCPIALAVARALPGTSPRVNLQFIEIYRDEEYIESYGTNDNTTNWIQDFDCGVPVAPFEFELQLPSKEGAAR